MNDVTVLTHFTPSILVISKITSIREVSNSKTIQSTVNTNPSKFMYYVFIASITKPQYIFLT